jgi:PTS system nitrogen regulatory IIA component
MSDLNGYIRPELIIPDLTAANKRDAIRQLVDKVFEVCNGQLKDLTRNYVCKQVISRENLMTTGVGNNLAFPHAQIEGCSDLIIAIGVSKTGYPVSFIRFTKYGFLFMFQSIIVCTIHIWLRYLRQ